MCDGRRGWMRTCAAMVRAPEGLVARPSVPILAKGECERHASSATHRMFLHQSGPSGVSSALCVGWVLGLLAHGGHDERPLARLSPQVCWEPATVVRVGARMNLATRATCSMALRTKLDLPIDVDRRIAAHAVATHLGAHNATRRLPATQDIGPAQSQAASQAGALNHDA